MNSDQIAEVIEAIETSRFPVDALKIVLTRLQENGRTPAQIGVDAYEIAKVLVYPDRRPPSEIDYPSGPEERWGYTGTVTPRLHERDWWPLRGRILRRDNHTCHYCDAQDERMCVDHVVPLSRGGSNNDDNLVACCIRCNSSKADRLLSEWPGRYR